MDRGSESGEIAKYGQEAEKGRGNVTKEDFVAGREEKADVELESSNEKLVEDERRGIVEAVAADLAKRGKLRRGSRMSGRILQLQNSQPSEQTRF